MKNILETLDENYILFENSIINVIIDNTDKIWFNAKQLTTAIGYKDQKDALNIHVNKKDKIQLQNINHSINIKQHPQTIYLSEPGMYKLMLKSRMKKAGVFADWITNDVLPSIRKYGYYKMKKSFEGEKTELLEKINYLEKQQKLMKNDLKKNKFPKGGLVYIIDYSDEYEKEDGVFRLGKTDDMNKRKKIYDTHMLHNKSVVEKELTDKPLQLENCIRAMLYDYRYKNKKDFFVCKKSTIKKAFKNCLRSIKNMNQTGGVNMLDTLQNKVNKLDKQIIKVNKLL
jgi:prophage antirepressor-like protein